MKIIFYFALFSLLSFVSFAQQKQYDFDSHQYAYWSLKYCPLGLIEGDQALSFASEYRFADQFSIQCEASYIFNFVSLSNNRIIKSNNGFRIVPEVRYYEDDPDRRVQRYMGIQLSYKKVKKEMEQWRRQTNFSRAEQIQINKYNFTGAFIVGLQNTSRRIGYDLNVGIGIKYKEVEGFVDQNKYIDNDYANSQFGEMLTGYYPQATGTFKLCIRLF